METSWGGIIGELDSHIKIGQKRSTNFYSKDLDQRFVTFEHDMMTFDISPDKRQKCCNIWNKGSVLMMK